MTSKYGPACKRGVRQPNRCNEDEPFVSSRVEASAERKEDERRKKQHVEHRYGVESLRSDTCRDAPCELIGGRCDSEDDHAARQQETRDAQPAMYVHAPRGDERSLRDQQQNPTGKRGPVDVNQQVRQRRTKHSRQKIRAREAAKNDGQNYKGHPRKK